MANKNDEILDVVCKVLDCDKNELLSRSKKDPYPTFRAFYWYALRRIGGFTNHYIATISTTGDARKYSTTAVGMGILRIIDRISKEKFYYTCWQELSKVMKFKKDDGDKLEITLKLDIPVELKDKIKFKLVENIKK